MLIDFVYPPESNDVLVSVECDSSLPKMCDQVSIDGTQYRVVSLEWVVVNDGKDNRLGAIINVITQEEFQGKVDKLKR